MSEIIGSLTSGGNEIEMTSENVTLYRHLGRHAVYDHLFVSTGEASGLYLWNSHSQYEEIATRALELGATAHINIQEPAACDVRNLIASASTDIDSSDSFPQSWLQG